MTLENNTVTQREHPAFEDDYIAPHRHPSDVSDRLAFAFVKALRFVADRFFADRYGHRAVVLETVAAVPGTLPSSWDSSCASELKTWPLRSIAITVKPNANTDRWRDMNRLLERIQFTPVHILRRRNSFGIRLG